MHDAANRNEFGVGSLDGDTVPEARETTRLDRRLLVPQLLGEVRAMLQAQPDGRGRRELLRKLESLQVAIDRWDLFAPRHEQVSAMLEMLLRIKESSDSGRSFWGH